MSPKQGGLPKTEIGTANFTAGTTATSNFGYFAGGRQTETNPNWESIVDRIDYSNDTATAVAKGSLATRTQRTSAVSSGTHGYVVGGANPAYLLKISH